MAAINFPDSPVNGDTHVVGNVTYVYDNAKNKWNGAGQTPNDRLTEGSNSLEINANNDLIWTGGKVGFGGNGIGSGLGVYLQRSAPATTNFYEASDGTKKMITGVDSTNDYVKIGSLSNHRLGLVANNGEKLSILPSGNIGIGENNPNTQLVVKGASNSTTNSVGNINVISSDSAAINLGGSIGLGGFYNGTSNSIPYANLHGKKENGTNNDAAGYFAISTRNSSAGTAERLRIKSNGDLKHTGLRSGGGENKLAILVTPSHNTNEEDVIVYQVENESLFNQITFGGGTASYNAATKLSFKTASAVDTTGGTERFSIDSNGIVRSHSTGISGSSLTLDLGSSQLVAGFQAKEMSGAAQALSGYWFNHGGLNAGIASTRQVTNQWGTDLRFYTHPFATNNQHLVYERLRIDPDGRIYIRDLLGNASAGSNVKYSNSDDELRYDTSSRLLKTNITECPYGIETVKKLKPSRYTPQEYDREGNINVTDEVLIGFIADEMVEEVPEVVQMYPKSSLTRNDEDTEIVPAAISYDKLTAVLTKALQEAIAEIETLKGRLDAAGL